MGAGRYILDGKTPKPAETLMEWAKWFETADRHVAVDMVGDFRVSTIFLGLDFCFGSGEPLLFETMVFRGDDGTDLWSDRRLVQKCCSTWDEAEAMHKRGCDYAREQQGIGWQPEDTTALASAIARLERDLPGWWWSVGACHVSSDATVAFKKRATIGPDISGPFANVLDDPVCDAGFDCDLLQPSTCAEALNGAIDKAIDYLRTRSLTAKPLAHNGLHAGSNPAAFTSNE